MEVIIAGAGISGLAAAISLRRSGHRVTIYERSSLNNEVGAALNIPPNASRFLIPWGVDPVKYGFIKSNGMHICSPFSLEVLSSHEISPDQSKCVYLAHRVDQHTSLKELAIQQSGVGVPVVIHPKRGVASYDPIIPSVTLQTGQVLTADLVIAADGIHSSAAQIVNKDIKAPEVASHYNCCYRFLIPRAEIASDPELKWFLETSQSKAGASNDPSKGVRVWADSVGRRRIIDYSCRNFETHNFVAICHNDDIGTKEEDWLASVDKSEMLRNFDGFNPKLLAIIEKKATEMKRWPLLYRAPLKSWTKGKLALCGDAAHPMLPHQAQGGAQGMEDGFALGLVMSGVKKASEIEERLAIYQKIRMNRASLIQVLSNFGADEVSAPDIADFLDGRQMPTSVGDVKNLCLNEDILERTVEHMKAFDSEWDVPEGFFPQQSLSTSSDEESVLSPAAAQGSWWVELFARLRGVFP